MTMKNMKLRTSQLIVFVIFLLSGCGDNEAGKNSVQEPVQLKSECQKLQNEVARQKQLLTTAKAENESLIFQKKELIEWANSLIKQFGPALWYIGDSEYPKFVKCIEGANPANIVESLNELFKKDNLPQVSLVGADDHTVRIAIPESDLLTQGMGTYGAEAYLKAVGFSLLSIESIECVDFDFEEGDHAVPGVFCKGEWSPNQTIKRTK